MKLCINVILFCIARVLAMTAVVMMLVSFSQPWWIGEFGGSHSINIYGWGLRHNVGSFLSGYVAGDITPTWQIALAWVYVGVTGVFTSLGAWTRKWWGSVLLGISGLGLIAYAYTAVNVVVNNRLADFGIKLEGVSIVFDMAVIASLQKPFYLAYIAGCILVTLAIIMTTASLFTDKQAQDY